MKIARFLIPTLVGAFLWIAVSPVGAQTPCPGGTGSAPPVAGSLTIGSPVVGVTGTVSVSGKGFEVASLVQLSLQKVSSATPPVGLGSGIALTNGIFSEDVVIPPGTSPGVYTISAVGTGADNGCRRLGSAPVLVSKVLGARFARLALTSPTRSAGEATSASGKGCRPNSPVTFGFDTIGNRIGTATSDAQGSFSGAATIPANAGVGQHGILASCSDPTGIGLVLNSTVDVRAASAVTMATVVTPLTAVVLVLLIGAGLLVLARRSYRASVRY